MSHSHDPSPVNPLPPAVWLLFACMAIPEAAFVLGEARMIGGPEAVGWRLAAINTYGFSGQAFDHMLENGVLYSEHLLRFLTYPFVHGSSTSFLFAGVILLAMGKMVGEVLGGMAVIVVFMVSVVMGAVVFALLTDQAWLIGGYPGVYGLIGTFTFLFWQRLAAGGEPQLRAFALIGFLMGIQLVFGIFFTIGYSWVAELSGFVVGFALTAFVVPGGVGRVLAAVRRRSN